MSVFTHEQLGYDTDIIDPEFQPDRVVSAEKFRGDFKGKLGIELQPDGCNFAIHAGSNVEAIELILHNRAYPDIEISSYRLHRLDSIDGHVHPYGGFIPRLGPRDVYSITVRYDEINANTGLLDPYAKSIIRYGESETGQPRLFSKVVETSTLENRPSHPEINPGDRVIYEVHIKGSTMLDQNIPEEIRGTYAGFAHPANIARLKDLGITTVELLPVQQNITEKFLYEQGRSNYWGYSTIGFFAPHAEYASGHENATAVSEFKTMVDELHRAGIEVVLDVVYNHTAEGGSNDPVYSFKGLDNNSYYHTNEDGSYRDNTGCGNMIDTSNPVARKLIMDSLQYWVTEMGVDGFRFDLAASLLRNSQGEIDSHCSLFLREINQDPVLANRLLIAEPWDIGGYPVGQFTGMQEWSGASRDANRRFWGPGSAMPGELARAIAGSLEDKKSINFVTAHDGFTLHDLTSYADKHNENNGENNRDGTNDNHSYNHGYEGPIDNPQIRQARLKTAMNLALTNLMSFGTPMVAAGDESLRTQHGNNNAYSQDNEISWLRRADLSPDERRMIEFMRESIKIRKASVLGQDSIHMGTVPDSPIQEKGLGWLNQHGNSMIISDWESGPKVFGVYSSGLAGESVSDSLLYYMNGSNNEQTITLPKELAYSGNYIVVAETNNGMANADGLGLLPEQFVLPAKSSVVLRRTSVNLPATPETITTSTLRQELKHRFKNIGSRALNLTSFVNTHATPLQPDFMVTPKAPTLPRAA